MNIITLDFETYYSKEYSLSKLTTEEYVRDERFQIIGCSINVNDGAPCWFEGHFNVSSAFMKIPWDNVAMLAHNNAFDGFILSHQFGIVPKMYLDTLSMARPWHHASVGGSLAKLATHYELGTKGTEVLNALGKRFDDFTAEERAQYGVYCCNDNNLCRLIYHKLLPLTPRRELLLIDRTIRMFCDPKLLLDAELLEKYLAEVVAQKEAMLNEVALVAPQDVLMSNQKLALLLESMGVDVPMKLSPATNEMTYAFAKSDKEFVALTEDEDPLVAAIVSARLGVKSTIEETRTRRYLGIAQRGTFPVALQYCGAWVTQRMSGGDKQNSQNLKRGGTLRKCIMAPPGYVLCSPDSSNIELRVNHTIAGQTDTVQALREGRDLYCEFASMIYGRTITKADKAERFLGKLAHLSLGYGCGPEKFREMCRLQGVNIDMQEAERIVYLWRDTYSKVAQFWRRCENAIQHIAAGAVMQLDDFGLVATAFERLNTAPSNQIQYPGLQKNEHGSWYYKVKHEYKYLYGPKMCENICTDVNTPVLTDRGWVPMCEVTLADMVHDGVDFVYHKGFVDKGTKNCVTVDGVHMTPDHKVLTDEGWKAALDQPKPYRPDLRHVDSTAYITQRREEDVVGLPVPVWARNYAHRNENAAGSGARRYAELRMCDAPATSSKRSLNTSHVKTPGVLGVAFHARQMQARFASGMEKLRGAWRQGMRSVAAQLSEFLDRHGWFIPSWTYLGAQGQQRKLHSEELPMGYVCTTGTQQARQRSTPHHVRPAPYVESDAVIQTKTLDTGEQVLKKLATRTHIDPAARGQIEGRKGERCFKEVGDLMDCGPLNRFVVRGDKGPFIVHNCQHLARNIVMEQLLLVSVRYPVVLTSHDNIGYLAPNDEADEALAFGLKVMSTSPTWWPDIPLAAEGVAATRYS